MFTNYICLAKKCVHRELSAIILEVVVDLS